MNIGKTKIGLILFFLEKNAMTKQIKLVINPKKVIDKNNYYIN